MVDAAESPIPAPPAERGLLAGIDEAGLGPILGPLVVAGVALEGPRGADPWELLATHVCRERLHKGKIRVADSKKVKAGKYGLQRLERTVLAFMGTLFGDVPAHLGELLAAAGVDAAAFAPYPWYAPDQLALPLFGDRDELRVFASGLAGTMRRQEMELLHIALQPLDVREFNASIARTDNKSDTHFEAYSAVIGELLQRLPGEAHLVADRCGGRMHYQRALRRRLGGHEVRCLGEAPRESSYEVRGDGQRVRITFAAQGEDRAFPTALASCAAKYLRELCMHQLNSWFAARVPDLAPTAGYYVDGHRFLLDVGGLLEAEDFPLELLLRSR